MNRLLSTRLAPSIKLRRNRKEPQSSCAQLTPQVYTSFSQPGAIFMPLWHFRFPMKTIQEMCVIWVLSLSFFSPFSFFLFTFESPLDWFRLATMAGSHWWPVCVPVTTVGWLFFLSSQHFSGGAAWEKGVAFTSGRSSITSSKKTMMRAPVFQPVSQLVVVPEAKRNLNL